MAITKTDVEDIIKINPFSEKRILGEEEVSAQPIPEVKAAETRQADISQSAAFIPQPPVPTAQPPVSDNVVEVEGEQPQVKSQSLSPSTEAIRQQPQERLPQDLQDFTNRAVAIERVRDAVRKSQTLQFISSEEDLKGITDITTREELQAMQRKGLTGMGRKTSEGLPELDDITRAKLFADARRGGRPGREAQTTLKEYGITASAFSPEQQRFLTQITARPGSKLSLPPAQREALEMDRQRQMAVLQERKSQVTTQRAEEFGRRMEGLGLQNQQEQLRAQQLGNIEKALRIKESVQPKITPITEAQQLEAAATGQVVINNIAQTGDVTSLTTAPANVVDDVLETFGASVKDMKAVESKRSFDSAGGTRGLAEGLTGQPIDIAVTSATKIDELRPIFDDNIDENLSVEEIARNVYQTQTEGKELTDEERANIATLISLIADEYVKANTSGIGERLRAKINENNNAVNAEAENIAVQLAEQEDPTITVNDTYAKITQDLINTERVIGAAPVGSKERMMLEAEAPTLGNIYANIRAKGEDVTTQDIDVIFRGYMAARLPENLKGTVLNQIDANQMSPALENARNIFQNVFAKGIKSVYLERDKQDKESVKYGIFNAYESPSSGKVARTFSYISDGQLAPTRALRYSLMSTEQRASYDNALKVRDKNAEAFDGLETALNNRDNMIAKGESEAIQNYAYSGNINEIGRNIVGDDIYAAPWLAAMAHSFSETDRRLFNDTLGMDGSGVIGGSLDPQTGRAFADIVRGVPAKAFPEVLKEGKMQGVLYNDVTISKDESQKAIAGKPKAEINLATVPNKYPKGLESQFESSPDLARLYKRGIIKINEGDEKTGRMMAYGAARQAVNREYMKDYANITLAKSQFETKPKIQEIVSSATGGKNITDVPFPALRVALTKTISGMDDDEKRELREEFISLNDALNEAKKNEEQQYVFYGKPIEDEEYDAMKRLAQEGVDQLPLSWSERLALFKAPEPPLAALIRAGGDISKIPKYKNI